MAGTEYNYECNVTANLLLHWNRVSTRHARRCFAVVAIWSVDGLSENFEEEGHYFGKRLGGT